MWQLLRFHTRDEHEDTAEILVSDGYATELALFRSFRYLEKQQDFGPFPVVACKEVRTRQHRRSPSGLTVAFAAVVFNPEGILGAPVALQARFPGDAVTCAVLEANAPAHDC